MYFLSNTAVTFLFSLYTQISLVSCFNCKGDDYVLVKPYLTCKKIYNCLPGYEILNCDRQCELLKCVKCADGYVQPDLIHWDSTHKTCFKKTEQHICTEGITYAHPDEVIKIRSCPKSRYCKCDNDECSYGPDPCQCSHSDTCQENETLDGKSGGCIPCPSGYLSPPGCGACFKNTRKKVETTTVPVHVMSTELTEAAAKSRFIHKLTTESSNKRSNFNIVTYLVDDDVNNMEIEESSQNADDNSVSDSNAMLIGIITGLVLLVICLAVVMVIKYQRGNRQQAMINDDEEGHEMDIVPRDHQNLRADAYSPNGRLPRNNPGCVNHVKEPESGALLNATNGHSNNNGNGVHQNIEEGGQRQTHSGPATNGARRNELYLQENGEIDCNSGNESSLPSEKDIDPEHFHLQRMLQIKEGSHGGHTSVILAARSDISEAGCPVASPSSAINPYESGASGTSTLLGGGSLGVDINRQTHRQESRSDNNKPIASPSDTEQQDSSSNSNNPPVNPKGLISGGTKPHLCDVEDTKKGQLSPDENEEETEQKRSYRRSMNDSGFDTNK